MLVSGLKHEDAMKLYQRADLIIDQLMTGWYGGFAVEAMAMGKPVVAYVRGDDLCHVPADMSADIPIVNATPDTIEDALASVLARPDQLEQLGRKIARVYALRWHNPRTIAAAMATAYRNPRSQFRLEAAPPASAQREEINRCAA